MSWTTNARKTTNYLLEMMDQGAIEPKVLAEICLQYMSEDDVADMARSNDLFVEDLEEQ
jgi:hypothetical protein